MFIKLRAEALFIISSRHFDGVRDNLQLPDLSCTFFHGICGLPSTGHRLLAQSIEDELLEPGSSLLAYLRRLAGLVHLTLLQHLVRHPHALVVHDCFFEFVSISCMSDRLALGMWSWELDKAG